MGVDRFITVATMQFKSDIRVTEDEYLKTYFTFKLGDIASEGNRSKTSNTVVLLRTTLEMDWSRMYL